MKKVILALGLFLSAAMSYAVDVGCSSVYVGAIYIDKSIGLSRVVFKAGPTNGSGSRWQYFQNDSEVPTTYWSPDAKKEVLSVLMSAKAMGHPVDISIDGTATCETGDSHYITSVTMAN